MLVGIFEDLENNIIRVHYKRRSKSKVSFVKHEVNFQLVIINFITNNKQIQLAFWLISIRLDNIRTFQIFSEVNSFCFLIVYNY